MPPPTLPHSLDFPVNFFPSQDLNFSRREGESTAVDSISQTLPLVGDAAPFRITYESWNEKSMVMGPAGLRTNNDCAGEDQQEFTLPDPRAIPHSPTSVVLSSGSADPLEGDP
jgi:hypothetical protein